jgi:hypothetical protein
LAVSSSVSYLKKGHLIASGEPKEIVRLYESQLLSENKDILKSVTDDNQESFNRPEAEIAKILSIDFSDLEGKVINDNICSGLPIVLKIKIKAEKFVEGLRVEILIHDRANMNQKILRLSSYTDNQIFTFDQGIHEINLFFPVLCLKAGFYDAKIYISLEFLYILDAIDSYQFEITDNPLQSTVDSLYFQPRAWLLHDYPPKGTVYDYFQKSK